MALINDVIPSFPPLSSVPGRDISSPRILRQLWGLTARCERAMRAIAPHWKAQKASWGEAACLFERLASPASWICELAAVKSEGSLPWPDPVIQLLASSVATALKAARIAGINTAFILPHTLVNMPALWQCITGQLPATISLLLPRMAAARSQQGASSKQLLCTATSVDSVMVMSQCRNPELCPLMVLGSCHMTMLVTRAAAELLHYCSGSTVTRRVAHFAVGGMSSYAAFLSTHIASRASQGCEGAPSGSAQLRDLLARPLLHLLHSPLLDTLVALQHIMVDEIFSGFQQRWQCTAGSSICPLNLEPTSTEPDASDSKVAMQVGHTTHLLF